MFTINTSQEEEDEEVRVEEEQEEVDQEEIDDAEISETPSDTDSLESPEVCNIPLFTRGQKQEMELLKQL